MHLLNTDYGYFTLLFLINRFNLFWRICIERLPNKWDNVLDLNKLWGEYERILTLGNIILFGAGLFAFKLALSNEKLLDMMVWKEKQIWASEL